MTAIDFEALVEMPARPVSLEPPYGHRARIGLIALSTDLAIERDFARMVPGDEVAVFTTRIHLETPNSDRTFLDLAARIGPASRLIVPDSRLDALVFGCTSAASLIGPERIAALVDEARPGTRCTNPLTGVITALRALQARRIAVLTPYTRQMTGNVLRALDGAGFAFSQVLSMGYDTDVDIGSVPAGAFVDAALALAESSRPEAIFISCTATKALNAIDEIERRSGLPVVVSNQAAFWHALRLAGWSSPSDGHGRLLQTLLPHH